MENQSNLGSWLIRNLEPRTNSEFAKQPEDLLQVLGELLAAEDFRPSEVIRLAYNLGQISAIRDISRRVVSAPVHTQVVAAIREFEFDDEDVAKLVNALVKALTAPEDHGQANSSKGREHSLQQTYPEEISDEQQSVRCR
jgi:hypothetical protein